MCFLPQAYMKVLGQRDFFKQLLIQNELIFMLYLDTLKMDTNTRRYNDLLSTYQKAYFDVKK